MNRAEQRAKIRQAAFIKLRARFRTNVEMADALGEEFSPSFVSQLLNGHSRIGDELATKIEKRLGLAAGVLDEDSSDAAEVTATTASDSEGLAERLKKAMEGPPKISQAALARACKIAAPSVSDWLSGKTKRLEGANLLAAARFLRVSPEWLATGKGGMQPEDLPPEKGNLSKDYLRKVIAVDDTDPLDDDEVIIPCLRLKLSAGSGRLEWEIDPNGKPNRYRKEWVRRRNFTEGKLVTMHVAGDSMSPGLPDGCLVTIDQSIETPRSGKRHAIDYMGEFFIKRLFRQPDGSILLRSDNPDKIQYADWVVPYDRLDALKVLGLIVHVQLDTDG